MALANFAGLRFASWFSDANAVIYEEEEDARKSYMMRTHSHADAL